MKAINQFMEDVITGGWNPTEEPSWMFLSEEYGLTFYDPEEPESMVSFPLGAILLDPEAWEAVGKVRGWESGDFEVCFGCGKRITKATPERKTGKHYSCKSSIEWWPSQAAFEQVLFMNRLAVDRRTIEQALTSLAV